MVGQRNGDGSSAFRSSALIGEGGNCLQCTSTAAARPSMFLPSTLPEHFSADGACAALLTFGTTTGETEICMFVRP